MSKTGSKVFAIKIIDNGFILKQMECLLARKVIQGHLRSLEVKTSNFKIYTMLVACSNKMKQTGSKQVTGSVAERREI